MKHCNHCDTNKDDSEFHKRVASPDGLAARCKPCQSIYDKRRANLPHRVEARAAYAKTQGGRSAAGASKSLWRKRNPVKTKAHRAVAYAIRTGKLFAMPCEKCGSTHAVSAHHDDYAKPLNIRWLCSLHHRQWHVLHGEALNP